MITGSVQTRNTVYNQFRDYIPEKITIDAYAIDCDLNKIKQEDYFSKDNLLIFSSRQVKNEFEEALGEIFDCDIMICNRVTNFEYVDLITNLPRGTDVLFINDSEETTAEGIKGLLDIGIDHINYNPYYPGIEHYKKLKIGITPGQMDSAPECVSKIIDIGPRMIDFVTLYKVMNKLQIDESEAGNISRKYMQKIINVSKRLATTNTEVQNLNIYLNTIVENLGSGIIVFSEEGNIRFANEEIKNIFRLPKKDIQYKSIKNLISREYISYFLNKDLYRNKTIIVFGYNIKLSKFSIPDSKLIVVTANKEDQSEEKKTLRQELILKGHFAKYTFDDLIGSSDLLKNIKERAEKLSKSDLTILIEGESGTGKELFASAIHNASNRKNGPFLAVNFSALPDELVESELFGYEEGAFTGAKKGGKIGFFELSDGGTIFLDEIGDISPKVQTKLLRVLQEKEVMHLGGTDIKKIDVRVIAATNKDLSQMVEEKQFRADLYYRLKMGYVYIPPLRSRISDLHELIEYFIKSETSSEVKVTDSVIKEFGRYNWYGNVRELKSTIIYMLAVRTSDTLTLADLPDRRFFVKSLVQETGYSELQEDINEELYGILKIVDGLTNSGSLAGREKISAMLKQKGCTLTPSQVRNRLERLDKMGLISKDKGKKGTALTYKGSQFIQDKQISYINSNLKQ